MKPDRPEGYRSIFLSDYGAKLYHQTVRTHLVDHWLRHLTHLQCGGRKGVGTDVAHHLAQSHQAWCRTKNCPSAILFFDFSAAFYSVIRQAIVQIPDSEQALTRVLLHMGMTEADIDSLLMSTQTDEALRGLQPHLRHILADMLTNTHFPIRHLEEVCITHRGTRPGDPVADILFNLCMDLVLRDFRHGFSSLSDVPWLGDGQSTPDFATDKTMPTEGLIDVTFVDDTAMLIHAKTNSRVVDAVQVATHQFAKAAARRGLSINFEPGKTELLWNIRGQGSRKIKEQLHSGANKLQWTVENQTYSLHPVSTSTWVPGFRHDTATRGRSGSEQVLLDKHGASLHVPFLLATKSPSRPRVRFSRAW